MNISASSEDYLEAIFVLQKKKKEVRGKDIADHLNIKRPSVTDAIKLLKDKQLVSQEKYGFIELTPKGKGIAEEVLKKHQLIKKFLQTVLGLDEKTADQDACKMEHGLSKKTIDLIMQYVTN